MATKITSINRDTAKTLRTRLEAALKAAGLEEIGISARVGKGRFGTTNVEFKVDLGVLTPDGTVLGKEASAFKDLASLYGLAPTDLGRQFMTGGHCYRVTGLAGRSRNPIIADRDDGKQFKFPVETVKALLASSEFKPDTSDCPDLCRHLAHSAAARG